MSLQAKVISDHFLPTPTAQADDLTPESYELRKSKMGAKGHHATLSINTAVKIGMQKNFLPTPTASMLTPQDFVQAKFHSSKRPEYSKISMDHFLPTPTTRDYKDTPGMALETEDGRDRTDQLPRAVFSQTSATESPAQIGGMRLSLEFQCWFQGYPVDWLKPLLSASEIQSSRRPGSRSRKPSPKPSKPKDPTQPF